MYFRLQQTFTGEFVLHHQFDGTNASHAPLASWNDFEELEGRGPCDTMRCNKNEMKTGYTRLRIHLEAH